MRKHQPTGQEPLIFVVIDEIANLTAYLTDHKLKDRIAQPRPRWLGAARSSLTQPPDLLALPRSRQIRALAAIGLVLAHLLDQASTPPLVSVGAGAQTPPRSSAVGVTRP